MDPPPPPYPTFRYWIANSDKSTFLTREKVTNGSGVSIQEIDGVLVISAHGPKNVFNHVDTPHVYASSSDLQITALDTAFTTEKANQDVVIRASINCETPNDAIFYLRLDGVEIGSHVEANPGLRNIGIAPCLFDSDVNSTMTSTFIQYKTTIPLTGGHTLSVHRRGVAGALYLNRTASDSNANTIERATSNVSIDFVN